MSVNIIAHAVGTTPESVFAVEFLSTGGSITHHVDPTNYTKHNPLFIPIKHQGYNASLDIVKIMKTYPEGTKFLATTANRKLLGLQDNNIVGLGKKTRSIVTLVNTPLGNPLEGPLEPPLFEINKLPSGAAPGSVGASCPWKQSIVTDDAVYIYERPFSNFTVFGFTLLGHYFPTLEHLIMFLRLLVLAPPCSPDEDPVAASYAFLKKTFTWETRMMKRHVVAHIARSTEGSVSRDLEDNLIEKNNKYFLYALYRKVHAHPGLLSFFLQNSKKTFYEVAPIESVWVINAPFDLDRKEDPEYLEELAAAAKKHGSSRNVFGKYLTQVAQMVAEDRDSFLKGVSLEEIFAEREEDFVEGFE